MGAISIYECDDCGFKARIDLRSFFYDCELNETVDFAVGVLTRHMGKNAQIKGYVDLTYCWNCEKFVKIYVICEKGNFGNICEMVEQGIHNYINNKIIELDELKEIKKREKYTVEKKISKLTQESYYLVTFPELRGGYEFPGYSGDTKNEVIEKALDRFHDEIDWEIEYCHRTYKKGIETNYIVLDYTDGSHEEYNPLNKITCPECHVKIDRHINEKAPCPKCNGKISRTGMMLT